MIAHQIHSRSLLLAAGQAARYNRGMEEFSDEDLVARYRQETDADAARPFVDELFRRYHTRVASWCYRLAGDRGSAADLAQDVFLKAYTNLNGFRGDAKFSTWLYMIARNQCFNELRSRATRREQTGEADLLAEVADDRAENVHEALERMESVETVRTLLAEALDETERQVMTLHYAEELTLDAVTRLLGLTNASGAKAYVVSARRKLSTALRRWTSRTKEKN